MTTRTPRHESLTLASLLCSDCGTGIPAKAVDGTADVVCFKCVTGAVHRAEADSAIAEAMRLVDEGVDEDRIMRRLAELCGDELR